MICMDTIALQYLSYGMYIIGAKSGERLNGQLSHRVFQTANTSPTVAASINRKNLTHQFIKESGQFTVSVLEQGISMRLLNKFGFKSGRNIDKFANLDYKLSSNGIPYLASHCLAYIGARVVQEIEVDDDFTLFIGSVIEAERIKEGIPMPFSFKYLTRRDKAAAAIINNREAPGNFEGEVPESNQDKYECVVCGFVYDPSEGDPEYGVPRGTPFKELPADWTCPLCDEGREVFRRLTGENKPAEYKEYRNDQIVVHWRPELCSHSAKCINLVPRVFDMSRRPWVDINASPPEDIIKAIDRCPSGALKYSLPFGSKVDPELAKGVGSLHYNEEHSAEVRVRIVPNGPLLIEGPVTIEQIDGQLLEQGGRFALCRCGLTNCHPFCNNNHTRLGWRVDQAKTLGR